jgi:phage-related protein
VGPIANYNLGSVQGEIKIDYDRSGVKAATDDTKSLGDETEAAGTKATKADGEFKKFRKTASDFGSDVRNTKDAVESFGSSLSVLATPALWAGGIGGAVAFTAAVSPVLGLLGLVPAVGGAAAAGMAVVKIATSGMGDAMKAVAEGDAAKLAEAMKKLSPEAQAFVRSYQAIKPALDSVKMDVQNALFKGLGDTMSVLATSFLPGVRTGFTNIAAAMNSSAKASANALNKPDTVAALNTLLSNTAGFFGEIDFSAGMFLGTLIKLAGEASQFLPGFGNMLQDGALAFDHWADAAIKSGSFVSMISSALDTLGKLVQIVINIGTIMKNTISAVRGETGGLLESIVAITAQMAAWSASAEGQEKIKEVFTALAAIAKALIDILPILAGALSTMASIFNSLPGPVQSIVASMLAWGGILGIVLARVGPLIGVLVQLPGLVGLARAGFAALPKILTAVKVAFTVLTRAMMANPFIAIAAAVIAIGFLIYDNWDAIVAFLTQAWEWISSTAQTIWGAITGFFSGIWDGISSTWTSVWDSITGFLTRGWQGVVTFAQTIWGGITSFFSTIWNGILTVVTTVWTAISTFLTTVWEVIFNIFRFAAAILLAIFFTIWTPIWNLIQFIWNAIVAFLTMIWTGIVTVATTIWNGLVAFFTMIWTGIQTVATTIWTAIVAFFTTIWDIVSTVFMAVWNAIIGFLTPIWETIKSVAETVWNAIVSVITTVTNAIWSVIQSVWNAIWGFLEPIWNTISSVASTVFNAISNAISTAWNAVQNVTSSVWNAISGFFSSIWSSISSAVSNGANNVWNFLTGLWDKIKGVAGQAIGWLVDAGRNIVTGLWNGIVSMGQWLWNSIMGWIKSVVPGPILSFLGIASPSKWMRDEVGKMIPQGIMVGMTAEESDLIATAKSLAENVGQAATGTGSISTLTAAANGSGSAAATVASTSSAALPASSSNTKSVTIGNVTIPIQGNLDPTNEVLWREAIRSIQESLLDLENEYA